MAAVVREEQDEGVIGDPSLLEGRQDLPDREVQAMHHRREDRARGVTGRVEYPRSRLDRDSEPSSNALDELGMGAQIRVARKHRIAFHQLLWRLQGAMWRVEGDVEEERLRGITFGYDAAGLRTEQIGAIALFVKSLAIALPIDAAKSRVFVVVDGSE